MRIGNFTQLIRIQEVFIKYRNTILEREHHENTIETALEVLWNVNPSIKLEETSIP